MFTYCYLLTNTFIIFTLQTTFPVSGPFKTKIQVAIFFFVIQHLSDSQTKKYISLEVWHTIFMYLCMNCLYFNVVLKKYYFPMILYIYYYIPIMVTSPTVYIQIQNIFVYYFNNIFYK